MKKTLNLSFLMLLCVLLLSCSIKKSFHQTLRAQRGNCSSNERHMRDYCLKTNFNIASQEHTTQEVFQIIDSMLGVKNRTIDEKNENYINKVIGVSYLLDGAPCRVSVYMNVFRESNRFFSLKLTNYRRIVVPKEEGDERLVDSEGNVLSSDKDGELKEVSIGSSCLEIDEGGILQINSKFKNLEDMIQQNLIRSSIAKEKE